MTAKERGNRLIRRCHPLLTINDHQRNAGLFQGEPGGPPLVDVKPAKKKKKQGA